nr:unnamed protein product [Digitaria exilis]
MEITLVRSVNASEVIEEEVQNRPDEVVIQGQASEVVNLSVNGICNVSDGADSQGDASLAVHSLEPSGGDHRSTEHVDEESTVGVAPHYGTSEHLGDAAVEVDTENRNTALPDAPHFDGPTLVSPSRQATLPVSGEVEIENNLVTQSAEQSLVSSQVSQGETEQADLSGVASDRSLQSERQQSIPVTNNLLERAQSYQSQPSHQTDAAPGSVQSAALFPVASMMFNHPPIDAEPLKNELHRLRLHMDTLNKTHELKVLIFVFFCQSLFVYADSHIPMFNQFHIGQKTQLRMECSQEIEKVKRKYDILIGQHDSNHLQQKKTLDDCYEKVLRNQSLAEDFRAKFISPSATQARAHAPRQTPQASQQVPMRPLGLGSSAPSFALSSTCLPPAPTRLRVQAPQMEQPSSSQSQLSRPSLPSSQVVPRAPLIPGNLLRTSSATLSQMPPPRGSFGVQSESAPRAPAPHLQFKSPRANPTPAGNKQQQVPTTSPRAAALAGNPSPSESDSRVATSGMPSLRPVLPATSLPSGSRTSHPGQRVPAAPNPALQVPAAGTQPSDSLDAWLTASLGLRATAPASNGPGVDVSCLCWLCSRQQLRRSCASTPCTPPPNSTLAPRSATPRCHHAALVSSEAPQPQQELKLLLDQQSSWGWAAAGPGSGMSLRKPRRCLVVTGNLIYY